MCFVGNELEEAPLAHEGGSVSAAKAYKNVDAGLPNRDR